MVWAWSTRKWGFLANNGMFYLKKHRLSDFHVQNNGRNWKAEAPGKPVTHCCLERADTNNMQNWQTRFMVTGESVLAKVGFRLDTEFNVFPKIPMAKSFRFHASALGCLSCRCSNTLPSSMETPGCSCQLQLSVVLFQLWDERQLRMRLWPIGGPDDTWKKWVLKSSSWRVTIIYFRPMACWTFWTRDQHRLTTAILFVPQVKCVWMILWAQFSGGQMRQSLNEWQVKWSGYGGHKIFNSDVQNLLTFLQLPWIKCSDVPKHHRFWME